MVITTVSTLRECPAGATGFAFIGEELLVRGVQNLGNQVVIVSGASSGIGEAIVRRLVKANAKVVLAARRADRLEMLCKEIDPASASTLMVACDVTVESDRQRLVEATLQRFGRIDALVNNAGYGTRGPVERVSVELIRKNYETNVFSLIALTQLVLPAMRERRDGCIINIGSVAGRIARPLSSIYDSTKHALEALTDGLRGELRPFGVRVTLIRPGFIVSEFIEAANVASAEVLQNSGPYGVFYGDHQANMKKLRRVAGVPDDIARLVEKALKSRNPAPRYSGPFHAKIFLFLKWILPTRFLEWILRLRG